MYTKLTAIFFSLIVGIGVLVLSIKATSADRAIITNEPYYPDQRDSVRAATHWLVREFQNDDGGYASLSGGANEAPSSIGGTLDASIAIAAAGYNPGAAFPLQENTPLDYLRTHQTALVDFASANGGQAGKVVLALTAAAVDPRDFSGMNYVVILTGFLEPSGAYGVGDPFKQAIAMLGVAAAGEPLPAAAVTWLVDKQAANGSWDDGFGTTDNPDATALAIMALLAGGRTPADPAVQSAVAFLAGSQTPDGWEYGPGFGASTNSTALVVQALSALSEDWTTSAGGWLEGGQTPRQALLAFQAESGAFQSDFGQGPFDDFYATVQAIPAAAGRPFPLSARFESARRGLACLDGLQDSTTGGWALFTGAPADAAGTSRAIQAIVAAGGDPQSARWTTLGGTNAVEALEALTPAYLGGGRGGRVGIVMQGVAAAGAPYDVSDFAGEDLPLLVSGYLSPTGEYDSTAFGIFAHAEAMLGLLAAGEAVAPGAVDVLQAAQTAGDWGDADSNGIALQVLGGLSRGPRPSTFDTLAATQTAAGGWGFGGVANPSASSEVVQGLVAVGQNPFGPEWSRVVDGRLANAADVVMAQQGESGCWPNAFGPGDDPFSTTDAILLLTRQAGWGFSFVGLPFVVAGQ